MKVNEMMEHKVNELREKKSNMEEIPRRKKTDLSIYEDNYKIMVCQIKKQREKQVDLKKKVEQTLRQMQNALKYQRGEKQEHKKYADWLEAKKSEKVQNDIRYKKLLVDQVENHSTKYELEQDFKDIKQRLKHVKQVKFQLQNNIMQKKREFKLHQK